MKLTSINAKCQKSRVSNSYSLESQPIRIIEAPNINKNLKNKRKSSKQLKLGSNKDDVNLDLTDINYDSFGYKQSDHFLEFLNNRPSKWQFIFRQLYPEDVNRRTLYHSQVIDPKTTSSNGLKRKYTKKHRVNHLKRSRVSKFLRQGTSSNLTK